MTQRTGRNEPSPSNRAISYRELKQHSTYDDAWISINRTVYDVTRFIHKHPFGDTFRGNLGTECGGLFSSAHATTSVEELIESEAFLRQNDIAVVGHLDLSGDRLHKDSQRALLDRIVYQDTRSDAFWLDLKAEVSAYLKAHNETTHYSPGEGALYVAYYLAIYLVLAYLTWIEGSLLASILLGVHMICALANVAHMATHYGFTRCHPLNTLAMHLFDLSGASGLEWQITHQTHHNQPHSSIDHQTNVYGYLGVRIHNYVRRRRFHEFQHLYFWLAVSPYLLFRVVSTSVWLSLNSEFLRNRYEVAAHLLARLVLLAQVAACAHLQGFWMAVLLFALYAISYSQTAFILLFNDHEKTHRILGDVEDVRGFHNRLSWAEVQVRTANNWYPTNWILAFVEFHYGYFNYHIEHHLFPSFKPSLLKKISPIVREICRKHDIPYTSTPFFDVQKSLQGHITKLGAAGPSSRG